MNKSVVVLSGGVGGAKLAEGFAQLLPPEDLTVIVNTGDDFRHLGLAISPDIDSVTYMLAGLASAERGWGRSDESWTCISELKKIGAPDWFQLGDRDLALHLYRTSLLQDGLGLAQATRVITQCLGVRHRIVPMTDDVVETRLRARNGNYSFQEYFVRMRCEPELTGYSYVGADVARPSAEVLEALSSPGLAGVVIAPSNPILSIGPVLAIHGISEAIRQSGAPVLAVSPFVRGAAIKGPAAKIFREFGMEPDVPSLMKFYGGLIDNLLADSADVQADRVGNVTLHGEDILMPDDKARKRLAQRCLDILGIP